MSETRYTEADHKRAFLLWRKGNSFRDIAEKEDMPSHETLYRWSKSDFDCPHDCKWHGYKELHNEMAKKAMEEVEKELPDPIEREKKRLNFLYKTERQLNELIEAGELEAPRTMKTAVDLLESIYNQQRLIKGKSTDIVERRGSGDRRELNLQKVMQQLNISKEDVGEDDFIEAVEDSIIEGDVDES